jgi:hypothetical protein
LDATLMFLPEDSGTAESPITYAAYPGEQPIISGGRTIAGWQVSEVNGTPCWTITLPEVASGHWYFTQLFVNGERRVRPRLPKQGYHRFAGLPDGHRLFDWYGPTQRAEYAPDDIQRWRNLEDVKIVALQHWFETHLHIKELVVSELNRQPSPRVVTPGNTRYADGIVRLTGSSYHALSPLPIQPSHGVEATD